jgi:hypothetical protein
MDDLNINKFLRAFLNWQSAQSMIENAGENAEAEKLAKKMEREAARHLDVAFRECVESVIRPDSALPGASDLPFIMGPGANMAYPPIGDAPIPMCECGHGRDQHLKMRYQCEILTCPCKEFVKNLSPNLTQKT